MSRRNDFGRMKNMTLCLLEGNARLKRNGFGLNKKKNLKNGP